MEEKGQACEKVVVCDQVVVEAQNDSSHGLQKLYSDLEPHAKRLRSNATLLLAFSILTIGSPEGVFGLIASVGVLCCAAPGSLGTAYAARCTRISAIICAAFAISKIMCMMMVSIFVLPELPAAIATRCEGHDDALQLAMPATQQIDPSDPAGTTPPPYTYSEQGAHSLVHLASSAGRHLQGIAQLPEVSCAKMTEMAEMAAPIVLSVGMLVEFCLLMTAASTVKSAAFLMREARRMGANAL